MTAPRTTFKLQRNGFTLIELLVVISIISLLISILLPALSKARQASMTTVCKSNLHQLGVVQHLYVDMFDGGFVPTWDDVARPLLGWQNIMENTGLLSRNNDVFLCPAEQTRDVDKWRDCYVGHYGSNAQLSGPIKKISGVPTRSYTEYGYIQILDHMHQPSNMILMTDVQQNFFFEIPYSHFRDYCVGNQRHQTDGNGWNYLFADGHVKFEHDYHTYYDTSSKYFYERE
jgi:prepilin-type N-terminal cleavage/methylation domain-containing protein/prepilin-type processing-associated H-X9-DG protein